MGAWKSVSASAVIAKNGKKAGQLSIKSIPHKNKDVAKAKSHSSMQGQERPTIKIKTKEGDYEIKFGITWKAEMKSKADKKNPLPPSCPLESVVEFTEIRFFVDKVSKIPDYHTLEITAKLSDVTNYGSSKDMQPVAMIDVDIKTGHMVMGKWTNHLKCCDILSWSNKTRNFK